MTMSRNGRLIVHPTKFGPDMAERTSVMATGAVDCESLYAGIVREAGR